MNTLHRTKKALFVAIFLVLATFSGGQIARAQTVDTPATTAQVDALKETLISLLTQLIAQLQSQINVLIAQQASTTQAVSNLASVQSLSPVFGTPTPSAPAVIPLRLLAGQAGSITTYLAGKDLSEEEKADVALHGSPIDKSLISVSANKTLDLSKTELWVDGVKENITATPYRTVNDGGVYPRQDFYISPNIYSFATKNSDGSYAEKIQFKFGDSDGEQVSTWNACTASLIGSYYNSHNCENMSLNQQGN